MLSFLMLVGLALTVLSLAFGLFAFMKGGEFAEKYSNQAMRWRTICQGVTLVLFILVLLLG